MVTDIATPENRGQVMAVYSGWFLFAVGLGPTPGGLIASWFGLQAIHRLRGPQPRRRRHLLVVAAGGAWAERRPPAPWRRPAASGHRPVLRHLLQHAFPLVSLVTITHFMARTGAIFVVVPLLVHDRLDLNAAQIGLALTLGNAVNWR